MGSVAHPALVQGFEDLLRREIPPRTAPEARRTVYEEARAGLPKDASSRPARVALEYAIASVEDGCRDAGAAPGPAGRQDVWSRVAREGLAFDRPSRLDAGQMALIAATSSPAPVRQGYFGALAAHGRYIALLWARGFRSDGAQDPMGYAWFFMEPFVHTAVVTSLAVWFHAPTIFDMPAFPFSVIGVVCWLSFRAALMAALGGGGNLIHQLEHPALRRFDLVAARSLTALFAYLLCGGLMMALGGVLGLAGAPEDPLRLSLAFLACWLMGAAVGITAWSLQMRYRGWRRIIMLSLRATAPFSGLFFVSEQMPLDVRPFFLWNPLLHATQIARSAWFPEYESTDANGLYVAAFCAAALVAALGTSLLDEKRPGKA